MDAVSVGFMGCVALACMLISLAATIEFAAEKRNKLCVLWLLFGLSCGALSFYSVGVSEDQQMQAHTEHCAELGRVAQYRTGIGYVCCEEITIEGKTLHDNCTLSILDEDVDIQLIC